MEEAHADVHEGSAVMGVKRGGVGDGLDAGADAADGVGVMVGLLRSDACGGHGGWGHRGLSSGQDYAATIIEAKDAGYAVGAVVDCRAEGGGKWGHVLRGERLVGRTERCMEAIKGTSDRGPFCLRFGDGGIERLEF